MLTKIVVRKSERKTPVRYLGVGKIILQLILKQGKSVWNWFRLICFKIATVCGCSEYGDKSVSYKQTGQVSGS